MSSAFLYTALVILCAFIAYTRYLDFNRDVPIEYLQEQSLVERTRKPNELAIHKSTKLDYSTGLRVGLGIRYDSYKLRNGNLNDVWELFVKQVGSLNQPTIYVGHEYLKVSQLNSAVHILCNTFQVWKTVSEIAIPLDIFLSDKYVLAVTIAAFLAQIRIHTYTQDCEGFVDEDSVCYAKNEDGAQLQRRKDGAALFAMNTLDFKSERTDFQNPYSVEKDRGTALKLSTHINHNVAASTAFTQLNLISAAASCIKHLPPAHQFRRTDRFVILQDHTTAEGVSNEVVKILCAFVAGAEFVLVSQESDYMRFKPTVLVSGVNFAKTLARKPTGFMTVMYYHKLYSLSRLCSNIGTRTKSCELRLVYVHRRRSAGNFTNWNGVRASLGVNVVEEIGHFNVAGPFLATDFYDYRTFSTEMTQKVAAAGAVVQANEIKLLDFDATQSGQVALRGYNIGKAVTVMQGVGQTNIKPDEDAFYRLPYVARWGLDGCLYILKGSKSS